MSAAASEPTRRALDDALGRLRARAADLVALSPADKAALLASCLPRIAEVAPAWVEAGCRAKGLAPAQAGEEWLAGPLPTIRNARLLVDSLRQIAARGRPALGTGSRTRPDGRLEIEVFPVSALDRVIFPGYRGKVIMQAGVDRDEAIRRQASFYQARAPEGGVSLVLGAGNVSSIPPMDCFAKLFIEGKVCLLKMNPVNAWVGPHLERALAPLIERGFLTIVEGGTDVGAYLVGHAEIDDVHITGSDKTHDLIVWGPPGAERDRRRAAGEPVFAKPISSELGNVSPVVIVPYTYGDDALAFQARNVVTMVANNVSFNCNAAKMLVTARGWPQRERFLALIERGLAALPPRKAYYPGAFDRYDALTAGRAVRAFGERTAEVLPWTFIPGVDASRTDDPLFATEPFCPIVSETQVGSADPVDFLARATSFLNDTLWGTLNACVVIPPALERDPTVGKALERALVALRYGTVAINVWPAVGYGLGSLPWGGHPSATLADIQSGLGWVHNTFMLEGIDKAIVRGALVARPSPAWFFDKPKVEVIGRRMVAMEAAPRWRKLPALVAAAL
jgi:aldehyde dehydrogenase (NAD(P)+)